MNGSRVGGLDHESDGYWERTTPVDLPTGRFSVSVVTLSAGPSGIDLNGDGRTNQDDLDYLAQLIGSFDPQVDFNGDGIVDAYDVGIFQTFLEIAMDQGVFGDADGDGDYDCDDYVFLLSNTSLFEGTLLDDPGYRVTLDTDFDGVLDATDYEALMLAFISADFDQSGFVDTDDYDAFVFAFVAGDPSADIDRSGFVDTDDFDAFTHAFMAGC